MKVDVIIPCYKLLKYNISHFRDLVHSIALAENKAYVQTVIVINDYPEEDIYDTVYTALSEYFEPSQIIIVQNQANIGQAASRNIGATYASAEYLHFIDQDDFVSGEFYKPLIDSGKDICLSNLFIYKNGITFQHHRKITTCLFKRANLISDLKLFLISNIAVTPGQYIVKKKVFQNIGGFPDLDNRGSDDYGFLFRLCQTKSTFIFNTQAIFYHRLHISQGKNVLKIGESLREFLNKENQVNGLAILIIKRIRKIKILNFFFSSMIYKLFFK